jgi:uncharacterized protein YqgC (DUF456 family)
MADEELINEQEKLKVATRATTDAQRTLHASINSLINTLNVERSGILGTVNTFILKRRAYNQSIVVLQQEIAASKQSVDFIKQRVQKQKQQSTSLEKELDDQIAATKNRTQQLIKKGARRSDAENKELKEIELSIEAKRAGWKNSLLAEKRLTNRLEVASIEAEEAQKTKTNQIRYVKYERFGSAVIDASKALTDLTGTIRDTQQKFGIAADQAVKLGLGNLKNSVTSYIDALTLTGPAVTMEQIAQTQMDFQEQFGGMLDPEAAKRLTQEAVKMGVTSQQLATARRVFMTSTMGNVGEAVKQQNKFIEEFKKKGLTAKDAMMAIGQNSELLARNGTRFATQFARAAAEAKKIGVDLGKIDQVGDSIIGDFEGFLEKSAELGAMGFGFDTSRLAQIAETGDTASLMTELRSQLAMTGKDITKLRRSEQLALSSAFGIPMAELQRLAGKGEGSGEKTMEQLTADGNSILSKAVDFLEGIGKILGFISTAIAGTIAISSRVTAINTGILAGRGAVGGVTPAGPLTAGGVTGGVTTSRLARMAGGAKIAGGIGAVTGLISGFTEYQNSGSLKLAFGRGLATLAGSVIGGALGSLIPIPGVGTMLGSMAGSYATNWLFDKVFSTADDLVSKPGYGKRALLTPSGTIALNNKDNIIAYADDLMGPTKLPIGSISKQFGNLEEFSKRATQVFNGLGDTIAGKFQGVKQSIGDIFGKSAGGLLGKFDELKKTGAGLFGGIKSSLMEKGPGLSNISGIVSGFKEGGIGGAFKSLAKAGVGKAIGGALGTLIPLPGVGTLLGSMAGGAIGKGVSRAISGVTNFFGGKKSPKTASIISGVTQGPLGGLATRVLGKKAGGVVGSIASLVNPLGRAAFAGKALGKLGGLFKKKSPTVATPDMPMIGENLMQTDVSQMLATQQPSQITVPAATVDTRGIEQKLNNFIAALQGIQINMDGAQVGKVLVNASEAAMSTGVFRTQSR